MIRKVTSYDAMVDNRTDSSAAADAPSDNGEIVYVPYASEFQMPDIMRLMKADLSEPYSIYTYRYFIHNWPELCIMVNNSRLLILNELKVASSAPPPPPPPLPFISFRPNARVGTWALSCVNWSSITTT